MSNVMCLVARVSNVMCSGEESFQEQGQYVAALLGRRMGLRQEMVVREDEEKAERREERGKRKEKRGITFDTSTRWWG